MMMKESAALRWAHRKGMQQLIEDCKAGKIDLILTKSIARFARNIVDCLSVIETLKNLDPPVGVKFEADNIYTLDSNGRMILTILGIRGRGRIPFQINYHELVH